MRYALGCAFKVSDLFCNFPFKKLKTTCKECERAIGDNHRQLLVQKIFRCSVKLIITDIVERNVTFWLPLTGNKKCNMHMKRVTGKDFLRLRKAGKWSDIDIVNSMFSGYEIGFYMLGKRTPRIKTVYVGRNIKTKISLYTNLGKLYGDGCIDTYIYDYISLVCQNFPTIPLLDIKRILIFAWKSVYLHNSYGGDLLITDKSIWCYIGTLKRTALLHFLYYKRKLITKIRVNYNRRGRPWDGYYYFALTEKQYLNYLSLIKAKGRPRKNFKFGSVLLYEILEECKLAEHPKKYIFRIPSISRIKLKYFVRDLQAKAELIEIREPLKFKDILINDNEYDLL